MPECHTWNRRGNHMTIVPNQITNHPSAKPTESLWDPCLHAVPSSKIHPYIHFSKILCLLSTVNSIQMWLNIGRFSVNWVRFYTLQLNKIISWSTLGPLLFIIFINDLVESCEHSDMFLYADDSKLFRHTLSDDNHNRLQDDLHQVKLWSGKM